MLHNHRRRSTEGWNLTNVLLDLSGGTLSVGQVLLDAFARSDATVITGNPAKLWIAALSIGYDLIFVAQHYWLYRPAEGEAGGGAAGQQAGGRRQEGGRVGGAPEPAVAGAAAARGGGVRAFAQREARRGGGGKVQP